MNTRSDPSRGRAVSALAVWHQGCASPQQPMRPYDKTFLTNYDLLKRRAPPRPASPATWPISPRVRSSASPPTTRSWWTSPRSSSAPIPR